MRRLLWLGIGLAVGALVVRKVSQRAQSYTPAGIAASLSESAGGLVESVRSFVDDVREGMAEREQQIHEAIEAGVQFEDEFPGEEFPGDEIPGDDQLITRRGDR